MIKEKLTAIIESALENAVSSGKLGTVDPKGAPILITRPKQPEHGDYALDLAFKLAGKAKAADGGAKISPLQIAEVLVAQLKELLGTTADVEIAGKGFINFRLHTPWFTEVLQQVHKQGSDFGRSNSGGGAKVLLEYVSANPDW
jgi:Arginyl-tRNA synthetase